MSDAKQHSWSANLETEEYADSPRRVIDDALEAIDRTGEGTHVNLVSHESLGHPEEYLYPALSEALEESVDWEFVERCGCGGYVTRVHV